MWYLFENLHIPCAWGGCLQGRHCLQVGITLHSWCLVTTWFWQLRPFNRESKSTHLSGSLRKVLLLQVSLCCSKPEHTRQLRFESGIPLCSWPLAHHGLRAKKSLPESKKSCLLCTRLPSEGWTTSCEDFPPQGGLHTCPVAKGTVWRDQIADLHQHVRFIVWCVSCFTFESVLKRKEVEGTLSSASGGLCSPQDLPVGLTPGSHSWPLWASVSSSVQWGDAQCDVWGSLPTRRSSGYIRFYCDFIVRIYDRWFFSYFFPMCEPRVILIMWNSCSLMYYFQKRMGWGGGDESLYSYRTLLFQGNQCLYIVMMNPTWASDGMLKFSHRNTQECLWGDSTVLYLSTLSAFGLGGSCKPYFPPLPKAFGECELCATQRNLFNSRCRRKGAGTLNQLYSRSPVFCNREVGNPVVCGVSHALDCALCRINWYLLNQASVSLVPFLFHSINVFFLKKWLCAMWDVFFYVKSFLDMHVCCLLENFYID